MHKIASGKRLNLAVSTRHEEFVASDYRLLHNSGITTARDGIAWHTIEANPGRYDFSSAVRMVRAARRTKTQVIWDLFHFGWPDWLDILSPEFVTRYGRFAREFARILRENGFVALIWNERQLDSNEFLRDYEELLKKFGTDYEKVRHDKIDKEILKGFFQSDFSSKTYLNAQVLDFEGLKGRLLSSSYMPSETDSRFEPMVIELWRLFEKYAESGKIQLLYNTNIFYTRL